MNSKRKTIIIVTLACLLVYCLALAACVAEHTHSFGGDWLGDGTYHWQQCLECNQLANKGLHKLSWVVDSPATTSSTGSKHEECSVCHKVTNTLVIPQLSTSTRTVDFYAINDFHGAVDLISSVGGYLKERKNADANTVLINSGDMFQGSMESNSNYGKLLSDCMEATGFDAFTFGNHEFDWGLDNLKKLAAGSNIPFLGANIYNWNPQTKQWGDFASDLAKEYTVVQLENGLRVGIIGVIGDSQITSISSNLVQTIGFKDPVPIVKNLSAKLRNEENCNVVVVSIHSATLNTKDLGGLVDAVFCGHSHSNELGEYSNGIPYIQGGSNGRYVSNIQLAVEPDGSVNVTQHKNIGYSDSWPNLIAIDELVDNANATIEQERNQVLTNLGASLNSSSAIPRLVCRAIAEYALTQPEGKDIVLAMVNNARASLPSGNVTYSDLYESLPFDNVVYVANVKGSDIMSQASGNAIWRVSGEALKADEYYKIAVIDYLLYHQDKNRNYNYFASAFSNNFQPVPLQNSNYEFYNYRLITRDYLLNNTINTDDYLKANNNTISNLLSQKVNLDY